MQSLRNDCEIKYLEVHFCVCDDGLLFNDSHGAGFLDWRLAADRC